MLPMTDGEFRKAITELKANGELPKVDRTVTKDKIAKAIAEGMTSTVELCETFGITEKTLKTYKSQLGIKTGRPKRNYKHSPRTLAIYEDLKEGNLTTAEIARKHGIKWQSVHKLRRKLEADGEL
jgi:transposase-like protein